MMNWIAKNSFDIIFYWVLITTAFIFHDDPIKYCIVITPVVIVTILGEKYYKNEKKIKETLPHFENDEDAILNGLVRGNLYYNTTINSRRVVTSDVKNL